MVSRTITTHTGLLLRLHSPNPTALNRPKRRNWFPRCKRMSGTLALYTVSTGESSGILHDLWRSAGGYSRRVEQVVRRSQLSK